jgi:hypothetical protein
LLGPARQNSLTSEASGDKQKPTWASNCQAPCLFPPKSCLCSPLHLELGKARNCEYLKVVFLANAQPWAFLGEAGNGLGVFSIVTLYVPVFPRQALRRTIRPFLAGHFDTSA